MRGVVIAGDGTRSAGQYVGIAPKANIVDVQVLDANGNGRMSSVLRGLEWVLAHQQQFNIRETTAVDIDVPVNRKYFEPLIAVTTWDGNNVASVLPGTRIDTTCRPGATRSGLETESCGVPQARDNTEWDSLAWDSYNFD